MSKLQLEATGTRIIVEVDNNAETSKSGIILPDGNKADRGTIVSIGHEVSDPRIVDGRIAVFGEYSGKAYEEEDRKYVLLNAAEIYGTKEA